MRFLRRMLICLILSFVWMEGVYGAAYIESNRYVNRSAQLQQDQLQLSVDISNTGNYYYSVFYSDCSSPVTQIDLRYMLVPKKIDISGVSIPMNWQGNVIGEVGEWLIIGNVSSVPNHTCYSGISGNALGAYVGPSAVGRGDLQYLPPGSYNVSITYYVGMVYATTSSEAISMIIAHGLDGDTSSTPVTPFTGVAACGQDSPTSGETIDFGTVTSNGTIQPGPLTTLGLVCNYDVALNDVTYSLTSNNPVTGEPSTGQNVAVALTNGATVTLNGGSVTQPDPKKVSVNITPSIDTRGATAGEGAGSATLTFNYE
ncbi:TPA: hypothetical protein ACX37D_004879 [Serratia marcescens]